MFRYLFRRRGPSREGRPDFARRFTIGVPAAAGAVSPALLLVDLEHSDLRTSANGGVITVSSAADVQFARGSNDLSCDHLYYSASTGRLASITRIPSITADLGLSLFAGKSGHDGRDRNAVWAGALAAWAPVSVTDRTGNGRDLSTAATADLYWAVYNADLTQTFGATWLDARDRLAVEAYVEPTATPGSYRLIEQSTGGDPKTQALVIYTQTTGTRSGEPNVWAINLRIRQGADTVSVRVESAANAARFGQKTHLVFLWRSGEAPALFIDGEHSVSIYGVASGNTFTAGAVASGVVDAPTGTQLALGGVESRYRGKVCYFAFWDAAWDANRAQWHGNIRNDWAASPPVPGDQAAPPVALPMRVSMYTSSTADFLHRGVSDGGTADLTSAGNASGAIISASVVAGKIRLTSGSSAGTGSASYTVSGNGSHTGNIFATVTAAPGSTLPSIPDPPSPLRTIDVSNDSQLASALAGAQPGDRIRLAPGTYSGFTINVSGTITNPIVLTWMGTSMPLISGGVTVNGSDIWLHRLKIRTATVAGTRVKVVRCIVGGESSVFVTTGATDRGNSTLWSACRFQNFTTRGLAVRTDGTPTASGTTIQRCHFTSPDPNASAARTALGLGVTQMPGGTPSRYALNALVEANLFENVDGGSDGESIEVKSSANTIRRNHLKGCRWLSLRFGQNCHVLGNRFEQPAAAMSGIKVRGDNHKIGDNVFSGHSRNDTIRISAGNQTMDANSEASPGTTPWDGNNDYPTCRNVLVFRNSLGGAGVFVGYQQTSSETLPARDTRLEAQAGTIAYGLHTGTSSASSSSEPVTNPVTLTAGDVGPDAV